MPKDTRTPEEIKRAKERDRRRKERRAQTESEFGAPPSAPPDDENAPLGVPSDYSLRAGRVTKPADAIADYLAGNPRPFLYHQADLDEPMTKRWDSSRIAAMQQEFVAVGLLPKKGYRLGVYDEPTRSAYKNLLEYANQSGMDAARALRVFAANPEVGSGSGGREDPFVAEPLDPRDIKAVIAKTAPDVLGRNLSAEEQDSLVAAYNNMLVGAQQARYNAAETGGTVMQPPSIQSFAEQRAKELHPEEASEYGLIQQGKVLYSMIGDFQGGKEF